MGTLLRSIPILVIAAFLPACGTSASSLLTADMRLQVQKAAGPDALLDLSNQAAQDAMIDSGSPGTTTSTPSPSAILYPSRLDLTVDLAAVHGGRARYPGSSGLLNVVASGSVTSVQGDGSVAYAATVTAVTELAFSDAYSGTTARLAQGSRWDFDLRVHWEFADADHWSVTAESTETSAGVAFSGKRQQDSFSGTLDGSRSRSASYVEQSGVLQVALERSSEMTVTWTDSTGTHAVGIQATGPNAFLVSVSGTTFGPLTRTQVSAVFRVQSI